MGVAFVEAFFDFSGVVVVLGEDNGFPQFFASFDFMAVFHEVVEDFVDGICIKEPLVEGGGGDIIGHGVCFFVVEVGFVFFFFFFAEIVVSDAFAGKFEGDVKGAGWHEVFFFDCGIEFVVEGGDVGLEVEEVEGISVDFVFGGSGEADE